MKSLASMALALGLHTLGVGAATAQVMDLQPGVEVKVSATPRQTMAAGIASFRQDMGERAAKGFVVHPGEVKLPLGPHAVALPFVEL